MAVQEVSFVVLLFAATVVISIAETLFVYLLQTDKMLSANILDRFMDSDVGPLHVDEVGSPPTIPGIVLHGAGRCPVP